MDRSRVRAWLGSPSLRLMAGASGLTTLGALPPFLLGAQAVWARPDLGVSLGQFGVGVGAFFAAAALGAVTLGSLFDRLGRRRGMVLAGALVSGGGTAMALLVEGWAALVVTMAVLGLGNAACQTTANLAMARALPPGRRGLGFGVKQSAVPLAIVLGGLAVPTVGAALGWRSTFAATAVTGALVLLRAALRPVAVVPGAPSSAHDDLDQPPWGALLLCGLSITFASAPANFLGAYLATWAYEVGLTASAAGLLMAAGSLGSIAVRVVTGHRADHRTGANLPVVAAQMLVGALCCAGLSVAAPWAVVVFGLCCFAVGWAWPGLLLFAVARLGRDSPARASGVVQAGAFTGGALGPVILGSVAGAEGFPLTWWVASASFVVAGVLCLLARAAFRRDLRDRPPREPLVYGGSRHPRRTTGPEAPPPH